MAAAGASVVPAMYSRWEKGGAGVNVVGIDRLRDLFLETRAAQAHGNDASLRRTQSVLANVEQALAEPGDNGIQAQLSDFWSGWDDVANAPGDGAARAQLLQRAQTLASSFNQAANNLSKLQADVT